MAAADGLDVAAHRSTVAAPLLMDSALVLTMEERHRDTLVRASLAALQHTFTLLEFLRLTVERAGPAQGLRDIAVAAHRARARTPQAICAEDIVDPHGGPRSGYESTLLFLNERVATLADLLLGPKA